MVALQVPSELDVARSARKSISDCPLLVVHGDRDTVVPLEHGKAVYENWPHETKRLLILHDAGHFPDPINSAAVVYRKAINSLLEQAAGCTE